MTCLFHPTPRVPQIYFIYKEGRPWGIVPLGVSQLYLKQTTDASTNISMALKYMGTLHQEQHQHFQCPSQ